MSGRSVFTRLKSRDRKSSRSKYIKLISSTTQYLCPVINSLEYENLEKCNIEEVHELVLQKLRFKKHKIPELMSKRMTLVSDLSQARSIVDRKYQLSLICNLDKQIEELGSNEDEEEYLRLVTSLFNDYQTEKRIPRKVSFKYLVPDHDKDLILSNKCIIANKILNIAGHYIDIKIVEPFVFKETCHDCGEEINDIDILTGTRTCTECGYEYSTITKVSDGYKSDTGIVYIYSSGSDKIYNDKDNFNKAIDRAQGKQPDKLPSDINDLLDAYFMNVGIPVGKIIRATKKLNSRGRRECTNRQMLHDALRSMGLRDHYPDINLIGKKYWGWELLDLSPYKSQLLKDYDTSQVIFDQISKERKSSLNTDYRLMKHLQVLNIPCCQEDFRIIKTRKILIEYERIWKIICKECKWTFHPSI